MKILSVNAGSSSLKFQMYEMPEETVLISGTFEKIGLEKGLYTIKVNGEKIKKEAVLPTHKEAVSILIDELLSNNVIKSLDEIKGIGHRVVHGGSKYSSSVVINDEVLKDIENFSDLAPLHNPANVLGYKVFKEMIPNAVAVAVFDTAFHQTMPEEAYLYALPYEWYKDYDVRKFGFHGTSHKYVTGRLQDILGKKDINAITCHIGNGGSLSAIKDGNCVDTTMGFTPNAGLVMGTRCGDIDATIIPYIMEKTGKSLTDVMNDMNKNSGFLGISGVSSDARDIEDGIVAGNERCILAQKTYVRKIVEYIAKYYVLLRGVDAICFTAGLGENSSLVRKEVIEALAVLGIKLDEDANNTILFGKQGLISTADSSVKVYVIPTDEEVMIARDTLMFLK